jgi:mono/diheme cytochrome c family protein
VQHQVEVGGGAMPAFKGQLTPTQIQDVAAYVSSVAGS